MEKTKPTDQMIKTVMETLAAWSKEHDEQSFVLIIADHDKTHIAWAHPEHIASTPSYDLGMTAETTAIMEYLKTGTDIAYDDNCKDDPLWAEKVANVQVDNDIPKWITIDVPNEKVTRRTYED